MNAGVLTVKPRSRKPPCAITARPTGGHTDVMYKAPFQWANGDKKVIKLTKVGLARIIGGEIAIERVNFWKKVIYNGIQGVGVKS